ncbi:MAG: CAP domain-containing protein [Candidatus Gribaldobacteria bacterium]|nr:CAP domain-containing protein [Candidatus Gribaldobacteria bacterium]
MRNFSKGVLIFCGVVVVGGLYYFKADLLGWFGVAQKQVEATVGELKKIEQEIVAPSPLMGPIEQVASNLTMEGTLQQTNWQRTQNGLPALVANAKLTAMAQAKANDMFSKQYFEHESPSGVGPSDLAKTAGYNYLIVGENLALGNFKDDATLLEAWMNSPGHRENILNPKYKEIGVAVKRGVYEGQTVWMAVQEFGRPASDCLLPNKALDMQIETNQASLLGLEEKLQTLDSEIKGLPSKRGEVYNQKIKEYNDLVGQYNALLETTKKLITNYNNQTQSYNLCAEGT